MNDFLRKKDNIINVLLGFVKEAKYVLFTKDINNPVFHDERYRLIEINEIIIAAKITIDDISRGVIMAINGVLVTNISQSDPRFRPAEDFT